MTAIKALPPDHSLIAILARTEYEAILRNEPSDPEWQGRPTVYGVSKKYLFRFDPIADMTTGDFSTKRIVPLAQAVLRASKNLHSALIWKEVQDFHQSTDTKSDKTTQPLDQLETSFNYQQLSANMQILEEKLHANRDALENAELTFNDAFKEIYRELTRLHVRKVHELFAQLPPIPKLKRDIKEFNRRIEQIREENGFETLLSDGALLDRIIEKLIARNDSDSDFGLSPHDPEFSGSSESETLP